MSAHPEQTVAELERSIADLETRLAASCAERNELSEQRVAVADVLKASYIGRAVLTGTVVHIPDFANDTTSKLRTFRSALGFRSILFVPLMREGRGIGCFRWRGTPSARSRSARSNSLTHSPIRP